MQKVFPLLILKLSLTQVINNEENVHFLRENGKESNENTDFRYNFKGK